MKKKLRHLLLVLLLLSISACSTKNPGDGDPIDDPDDDPVDEIDYVIEDISQERPLFSQGLLPVRQGELWGYVDKTGSFVIEPKYVLAQSFRSNGLAIVATGTWIDRPSAYGVIDLQGNWVIDPSTDYFSIRQLDNGTFYLNTTNGDTIMDKNKVVIFNEKTYNQKIQEDPAITDKYEYVGYADFEYSLGMFVAHITYSDRRHACGYLNMDLEWAIEPKFATCLAFGSNGFAMASIDEDARLSNFGFINTSGEFVLQPKTNWSFGLYDNRFNSNGYANMSDTDSNLIGVIDSTGSYVIEPKYENLSNFVDDLAVYYSDKKIDTYNYVRTYGVVDVHGNTVVKGGLYAELGPISNGFIMFQEKKTNKIGYLNYEGKVVIPAQFQETQQSDNILWTDFDQMTGRFMDDGYAVVIINNKLNVIDSTGKTIYANSFDEIYEYDEYNDKYNIIRFPQ